MPIVDRYEIAFYKIQKNTLPTINDIWFKCGCPEQYPKQTHENYKMPIVDRYEIAFYKIRKNPSPKQLNLSMGAKIIII
ncbi:MAG: hypothetical protein LBG17_09165 [Bacteroidales bacterium]|jgi:hypothetical protein|nr:hypothetical protein [Bacteroidales bacterium]